MRRWYFAEVSGGVGMFCIGELERKSRSEALRMSAKPSWWYVGIGDERADERDMDDMDGLYEILGRRKDIEVMFMAGVEVLADVRVDVLVEADKLGSETGGSKWPNEISERSSSIYNRQSIVLRVRKC